MSKLHLRALLPAAPLALALIAGASGCGSKTAPPSSAGESTAKTPRSAPKRAPEANAPTARLSEGPPATNRPPDHAGLVYVAEWHQIREGKNAMIRPPKAFAADLERLYRLGFRPVTAGAYLSGRMDLPKGATPVVMTFDDSHPTQLRLKPDGALDPACAVGIWKAFSERHPDFPVRGTFYVLPDVMWGQPKLLERKLAMLRDMGSEIENHTVTHTALKKLSDAGVKGEIDGANANLAKHGAKPPYSLALPYGISPRNRALLNRPDLQGVFLVGANPAPAPGPALAKVRTRIPRIQSYDGPLSLGEWLGQAEKGRVKLYVE